MSFVPGGAAIMKLIQGAEVYAPEPLGRMDVLVAGGVIACLQPGIPCAGLPDLEVVDARGKLLVPGFIDGHVHILGGGGEGGYASRTPEILLSDLTTAGVTTVVGCLGTDGTTRALAGLLAKARGLEAEGVTVFIYTGSYQVPVRTVTGSVVDDLILIDKVIGVGEIALSDHRSSQPTFEEVARIAAEARVGGMLSGKAGVVNVHMGAGERMLGLIERVLSETEIPAKHFIPTHINRNQALLRAGIGYATQDAGRGRHLDLTSSLITDDPALSCAAALATLLRAGVSIDSISFSSDGQGSLPLFDAGGEYSGLGVGKVSTLFLEVQRAVRAHGVPFQEAVKVITSTPAAYLGLPAKGRIRVGADADLVLLDRDLEIDAVLAMGRFMVKDHELKCLGTFEQDLMDGLDAKRPFGFAASGRRV
jgi:beta-aspartyl-dipeptidase (metallo-type)